MMPFDAYRCYLSLKNHFTKDHYDYYKNEGRTRVKKETFYKRKDRFWFERFARQKNDKEVVDFFVSNFVSTTDPSRMYIGELVKNGEERYVDWKKRTQSLSYVFRGNLNLYSKIIRWMKSLIAVKVIQLFLKSFWVVT